MHLSLLLLASALVSHIQISGPTAPIDSPDGTRVAFVQKTGRKKYNLVWAPIN